jgi:heat shock protein HslJ
MRRTMMAIVALAIAAGATGCGSDADSGLVGATWEWTALSENAPKHQSVVPEPENYTITFSEDGNFQAKADCNQLAGTYTEDGDSLTIEPGPMTLVACPPESLSDQYVALLGTVSSFAVDGKELTLQLGQDAGEMQFTQVP